MTVRQIMAEVKLGTQRTGTAKELAARGKSKSVEGMDIASPNFNESGVVSPLGTSPHSRFRLPPLAPLTLLPLSVARPDFSSKHDNIQHTMEPLMRKDVSLMTSAVPYNRSAADGIRTRTHPYVERVICPLNYSRVSTIINETL